MRKPDAHNTLADVRARLALLVVLTLAGLAVPAAAQPGRQVTRSEWQQRLAEVDQNYEQVLKAHSNLYAQGPVVELVTMGVGGLIWERHGHIALCIHDNDPREDDCYNYGIGDFRHPLSMVSGFFRGANSFWVGIQKRDDMFATYLFADRTIWIQPLPLTQEQVAAVRAKLDDDVKEENKHYSYDHFWDNCTTRVRDVIDGATGGAFKNMQGTTDGRTFRELAREGFHGLGSSWLPLLTTDIAMGRVTDQVPTFYERMFLPDYLREAVATKPEWKIAPIAVYQRKGPLAVKELEKKLADGGLTPEQEQQYKARLDDLHSESSGRFGFALLVLLLTAPAWATRLWGRFQRTGMAVALAPILLLGTIFWFLAIISPLPYVRWNETCLFLMPFDALLLFLPQPRRQLYARGRVAMLGLCALLMLINVLKAPLWPVWLWALVPNAVVGFWPRRLEAEKIAAPTEGAGEIVKTAKKR